jgi:hypothetical protein
VVALLLVAVTALSGCTDTGATRTTGTAASRTTAADSRTGAEAGDRTAGGASSVDAGALTDTTELTGTSTATGSSAFAPRPELPPADLAAIRGVIDRINATAGGPVADQRTALEDLVVADQAAKQRSCPPASGTISFEPAYPSVRRASVASGGGAVAASGGLASGPSTAGTAESPNGDDGTEYLLPAFITIYSGSRITGTDLTTLHLWVQGGVARTAALCVS